MKPSRFNVVIPSVENPPRFILYNTFHDHRLLIDGTDVDPRELFQKVEAGSPLTGPEQEAAEDFLDLGILLDDAVDERTLFDDWYVDKIHKAGGRLSLIVATTMACNLRCPYCFEAERLDNSKKMSAETATRLVAWVVDRVKSDRIEDLEVVFFGGEPLMNRAVMVAVGEALKAFAAAAGIAYEAGIITNGVLLGESAVRDLRRAGVTWVKVTLDGDAPVHDTTRITSFGKGSFDTIFRNLIRLNEGLDPSDHAIAIDIGGNFGDKTVAGFYPLLDRLAEAPFRAHLRQVNLKPTLPCGKKESGETSDSCGHACFTDENVGHMVDLREAMNRRGLPVIDALNLGPCDFQRGDAVTIGIDGRIYPCGAFVGNEAVAIGDIHDVQPRAKHADALRSWSEARPWADDCYTCAFLPVCTGGCRVPADAAGKIWDATVCEKTYFQRMATAIAGELFRVETNADASGSAETIPPASG